MNEQNHYFIAPVEANDQKDFAIKLSRALISRQCVHRFLNESEKASRAFLEGRVFNVKLEEREFKGRLIREQGHNGIYYNLKLLEPAERDGDKNLAEMLSSRGFASPWKREFPRISVASGSDREIPAKVMLSRMVGRMEGKVLNFSYHGLLFQFPMTGLSLGEYVGQRVQFHIFSNRSQCNGKVDAQAMRIYDELVAPGKILRSMGVRFLEFHQGSQELYQNIFLEAAKESEN